MPKKRVCILVPSHWAAKAGGAEMQVKRLVERLASQGHCEVHYVARHLDSSHEPQGYTLHQIPARKRLAGTFLLESRRLASLLARLQPDVIYQRVACSYTGVAAHFARHHRSRLIWHVSSDRDLTPFAWRPTLRMPIEQLNRAFIRYGARHADIIVVQTAQQARLLQKYHGRTDAVQISNFHPVPSMPSGKPSGKFTVCWIGNIKEIKNPSAFLRLAEDFARRPQVEFIMAGAPQMSAGSWREMQRQIEARANLRYLGFQTPAAVAELLDRAHVLVNTSPVEGFPNTFIEAWMRDVCVLSLAVNPDGVFDQNANGICANGDYRSLKDALQLVLEQPTLREAIAAQGNRFARERFTERNIDKIIALLDAPRAPVTA